jgi:hypothetical protein
MRPQVVACRAWGAQNASGGWDYQENPYESRAQGGNALGGVLFSPPEFEMEDYFSINSQQDVKANTGTNRFILIGPGVGLGFGVPETDGGVAQRSVILKQTPSNTDSDEPFVISQVDGSGVQQALASFGYNQSGSNISISLNGAVSMSGSLDVNSLDVTTVTVDGSSTSSDTVSFEVDGTTHELVFQHGILMTYTQS